MPLLSTPSLCMDPGSPEMREQIASFVEPEESYVPGTRVQEPFPAA